MAEADTAAAARVCSDADRNEPGTRIKPVGSDARRSAAAAARRPPATCVVYVCELGLIVVVLLYLFPYN